MSFSAFILFELLAVALVDFKSLKILLLCLIFIGSFKKKRKEIIKEIVMNFCYVLVIYLINIFVLFNVNLLNFLYLGLFSLVLYFRNRKVKVEDYCSFYLFVYLLIGVINL